jgi:hypothetical protein
MESPKGASVIRRAINALVVMAASIALAACGSQTKTVTVAQSPSVAASVRPALPSSSSPAPPSSPTGPSTYDCVMSTPAQFGLDMTPIISATEVATKADCQKLLDEQNKTATGAWAKSHPSTLIAKRPTKKPVCTYEYQGTAWTVWGTAAAKYVCSALG